MGDTMTIVFLGTAGGCTHIEHTVELSTRRSCMDGPHMEENVSLGDHTTLRAGGKARFFVSVSSEEELVGIIRELKHKHIRWNVIGGGSNILCSDDGFDGCVIKMDIQGVHVAEENENVHIHAGAGVSWDAFVSQMVEKGVWGVENLSGIPGTVGATPIQNVGAYSVEVKGVITDVRAYDTHKESMRVFSNTECQFAYRDSFFKHAPQGQYIITNVSFSLSKKVQPTIAYKDLRERFGEKNPTLSEIREGVLQIRSKKFPDLTHVGTAGSFFKNPIVSIEESTRLKGVYPDIPVFPVSETMSKISLAWVLDKVCHLKGYREGNVALFEHQPLVLVAYAGATEKEIHSFAHHVEEKVFAATGIHIEREVVSL
ncbi:MAG: UDP-N-acetylmuramate dehydrogenase [Patescibacteria group bacterium]